MTQDEILENVPCVLDKKVYSGALEWTSQLISRTVNVSSLIFGTSISVQRGNEPEYVQTFKKMNKMKNMWIVNNEASLKNEMTDIMILFVRNS